MAADPSLPGASLGVLGNYVIGIFTASKDMSSVHDRCITAATARGVNRGT